jgi:hypothetical protein
MPIPPPPAAALTRSGYPTVCAASVSPSKASGRKRRDPGTIGTPGLLGDLARALFVAHAANDIRGGTDPSEAGGDHLFGKIRILREEAVAGVDGVGTGSRRRIEHGVDLQIAIARRRGSDKMRFICGFDVHRSGIGF